MYSSFYWEKSLVGPGQYVVNDTFDSKNITPRRNVFSLAAKKNFADDAIKKSVTPGPIYYVAWCCAEMDNMSLT